MKLKVVTTIEFELNVLDKLDIVSTLNRLQFECSRPFKAIPTLRMDNVWYEQCPKTVKISTTYSNKQFDVLETIKPYESYGYKP